MVHVEAVSNALVVWTATCGAFWVFALLFCWLDATKLLWRFKVVLDDPICFADTVANVLFNQVFVLLPCMLAVAAAGLAFQDSSVPWFLYPVHVYLLGVVHDVVFFLGHKLLHTPALFRIHQRHHQSRGGTASSSMYMHPLDFLIEIVAPYGVFLCIVRTSLFFDCTLAIVGSLLAMYEHSGYCFTRWKPLDSRMHLSHHIGRLNGSFSEGVGSPGYMDRLFGTALQDSSRFMSEEARALQ